MKNKRFVALSLVFALVLTMFAGVSAEPVNAASKKYEVPVKVIHYSNASDEDYDDIENAVWENGGSETFKYNKKGYVTAQGKCKTKWTLKKAKRVKAKTGSKKMKAVAKSTYKKGKLKAITFTMYNKKGKVVGKGTEKYSTTKASKGWVAKISGKKAKTKYTVTYKYTFHSNGLPKTIKEIEKAYGKKYVKTYSFNEQGLITKVKTDYGTTTFKYEYKDGKVVERYEILDGFIMYKDVFVYGGVSTKDKKTYFGTINVNSMEDVSAIVRDALPPSYPWLAK